MQKDMPKEAPEIAPKIGQKKGANMSKKLDLNDDLLGRESCQNRHQKLYNQLSERVPNRQRRAKDANC